MLTEMIEYCLLNAKLKLSKQQQKHEFPYFPM